MSNPFAWSPGEIVSFMDELRSPRGEISDHNAALMRRAADKIDELVDAIIRADVHEMSVKARDILINSLGDV